MQHDKIDAAKTFNNKNTNNKIRRKTVGTAVLRFDMRKDNVRK